MMPIKKFPGFVLAEGEHEGFRWLVARNRMGARCGYVAIPLGHPWYELDDEKIPADCHGGLTYSQSDTIEELWWIGFDCLHAGDAADPDLPRDCPMLWDAGGHVWTQAEVEAQCRLLCTQAKEAKK